MKWHLIVLVGGLGLAGCQPEGAPKVETPEQPQVEQPAPVAVSVPVPESAVPVVENAAPAEMPAPVAQQTPAQVVPAPKRAENPPPAKVEPQPAPIVAPPPAPVAPPVSQVKSEAPAPAGLSREAGLALAKKSNCLTCHAIDKKVVGPAWRDVAAKYRGDAGARDRLADKMAKGGSGNWGAMPMPGNSRLSLADREALATFVLSLE